MKKLGLIVLALAMVMIGFAPVASAADAGAAAILSCIMPGTGEWYNGGFRGGFPWGECILGSICCFVQLSSIMDAACGDTSSDIRLDFWSAPGSR